METVDDFREKEMRPNLGVAELAMAGGVQRWSYLSGMGVARPEPGSEKAWYTPMFSFVKVGCARV